MIPIYLCGLSSKVLRPESGPTGVALLTVPAHPLKAAKPGFLPKATSLSNEVLVLLHEIIQIVLVLINAFQRSASQTAAGTAARPPGRAG